MDRRAGDPTDTAPHSPFAETLAATPVGPPPVLPSSVAPPVLTFIGGERVDARYVMRARLGEGGMGEVRLCHDERLGRDVAMKVMRAEHIGRADLDSRFLREARVQGRLEHPSVVPVYDLGMAGGTPFFTMKRVHAPTLAEILAELRTAAASTAFGAREGDAPARFSRHKLLAAFASVCLAVDFAHAHGVIHRDLKPDNIMLGSYGELYVLDWGIAKVADAAELASSPALDRAAAETKAGAFFGTLGYMAPEQLDGALGRPDLRSDVYALGAILFEILTLEPLHPLATADKMVASTLRASPVRPSARAPSRGVPPELDEICVTATARDQSRRFASARELYAALERFRARDRDLEQRRVGAEEHASRAIAAAKVAETEIDPQAPARTLALREASRALAFDPSHAGAALALRGLLASPPRLLPPEVVGELRVATERLFARVARGGSFLQLSWFLYFPFALLVGLRDVRLYGAVSLLFLISATDGFLRSKRPPSDGAIPWTSATLAATAIGSLSLVWSPFILVPPVAVSFAVVLIVVRRSRAWPVMPVLLACTVVAAPVLLDGLHLVPPFFAQAGGVMLILPRMVELPEKATLVVATLTLVLVVGSVAAWFIYLRSELDAAQLRLRHHAWQLRHMVAMEPEGARVSLPPDPPAPQSQDAPPLPTAVDTGGGRQSLDALLVDDHGPHVSAARYEERGRVSSETDGSVRLCEDHRIGRQVAMKVIASGDPDAERLVRQLRIQARLEHPAIPPIYDIGEDAEGATVVTVRRLRGTTLAHALADRERYSQSKRLEAFGAGCLAIEYAHANGVAHAALGTDHVVLGDYGEVYVTGWGSAVEMSGEGAPDALVRADIAALGAILAELLDVPSPVSDELGARPSLLPRGAYAPPELEAVCAKATGALDGDGDAFRTAGELHDAVERFVEGERDVVRRKARAFEHARVAELAAERAFAGDAASRAGAMHEVSQALALDPSNALATAVLMKLFTAPARELPPEAADEMQRAAHDEQRRSARIAAMLYATFLLYVPWWIAQGLLSPLVSVLVLSALVLAVLAFWRVARARTIQREPISTVAFAMLAAAAVGTIAGPLVFVPTIVIGNLGGFLLKAGHRRRALVIVLACLAFAAPLAAQLAGIVPPSYAAHGSALAILPHLTALGSSSPALFALAHVALIFSTSIFFRRFRDSLHRAEESVHVNTWQLRQLVPLEARAAVSIAPPANAG